MWQNEPSSNLNLEVEHAQRQTCTVMNYPGSAVSRLVACSAKCAPIGYSIIRNRKGPGLRPNKITVGKTYVHQVLQQHDYEIQILRRNLKHAKPKPVPRNLIWGIDLTGKTDTNGKLHALFGILDHGSRALLYLHALHDKTSHALLACLLEVIRTHGKPKIIRTDNEAIFTSKKFRLGLKLLGIRHQLTDPGCPWQNGRIERLFGTLKQKLDQWQVPNFAQLNHDLDIFRHWYNHVRPHQNLDGKTPFEAWNRVNPYTKPPKQEQWFEAWGGLLAGYCLRY